MFKKNLYVNIFLFVSMLFVHNVYAVCDVEWSECEDGSQVAVNISGEDCENIPVTKACGVYDGICTIGYMTDAGGYIGLNAVKNIIPDDSILYNFNNSKYSLGEDSDGELFHNDMGNVDVLIASDGSNDNPTGWWSGRRWELYFENAIQPAYNNGMSVIVAGDHTRCMWYGCAYASDMITKLVNNLQDDYSYGVVPRAKIRYHSSGKSSSSIPFFDGLNWYTASTALHTPGNMRAIGDTNPDITCPVHPAGDICLFAYIEPHDGKGWVTMDGNVGRLTYPALSGDTPTGASFFDVIPDCMPKSCGTVYGQVLENRPEEDVLCGVNSVLVGNIENTQEGWQWQCGLTDEDMSPLNCSALRNSSDENGQCDPETVGNYSCTDTEFRGVPCLGGIPVHPISFPSIPTIEQGSIMVSWGCNGIGAGTATEPQQCSAVINPSQAGKCNDVTNNGQFINKPTVDLCCNPDNAESCETEDTFLSASVNELVGTQWSWNCDGTCSGAQANCSAECKPEFDLNISSNPFPLTEDGVTVEISLNKIGPCAANYSCTIDGNNIDSGNILKFDNMKQSFDIILNCISGENVYRETVNINSYCTTKQCNAQGTCQASPVQSDSLDTCTSTCNSNADCSIGRFIETQP